ncbi:Cell division protein Cdc14 [Pseudohyphozyma bogoriensis]|nr:Cell division protein Cdc14 [Pseudohyphozyma bogoriensis]
MSSSSEFARIRRRQATAVDILLSPSSTPLDTSTALTDLSALLASLPLAEPKQQHANPNSLDAFLTLQDSFEHNLTESLLAWLGRVVWFLQTPYGQTLPIGEKEAAWLNAAQCLGLIQGLIKAIEILYYYLLPETDEPTTPTSTSTDQTSTSSPLPSVLASAVDFVPQTPLKPRGPFTPTSAPSSPTKPRTPRRTSRGPFSVESSGAEYASEGAAPAKAS